MSRRLFCIVLLFFVFNSCAFRQDLKEVEKPAVIAAPKDEELKLPDIPLQSEDKKDKKTIGPVVEKKAEEERYIMLNFQNADIETVVSTIGEMLKINYIVAPGVSGKITIQSHKKVPLSELFSIFQTILEFNGFTAVKDGSFYRIVPIDSAKQQPVKVESGKSPFIPKDSSFVTQSVPLEFVEANDVANIVRNLMPRGTDIIVYEPSNMLIVTAAPSGILKLLKLLEVIDISPTERDTVRTFVYHVENGEAKKLAGILKSIYGDKKETKAKTAVKSVAPTPTPARPAVRTPTRRRIQPARPAVSETKVEGLAGSIEGEVTIEAYEDINALIIQATPRGYLALLETIKKLDIQPKQVLIEVLIAEINLDDTTKLGIEWLLRGEVLTDDGVYNVVGGFTEGNVSFEVSEDNPGGEFVAKLPTGVFANIFDPARFNALISAAATADKINVLASPHILAIDNQEARIEIAQEVPVATSISQPQETTANTISQVQFKSAGIILNVTPHINDKKQVTLKISQEASELGEKVPIGGEEFQGFRTRKVTTSAIVQDGHTLVLGGIITTRTQETRSGIPVLSKIPLLGYLFGTTTDEDSRDELLLMVTPHVVSSHEEADLLTAEYESRVGEIKKKLERDKRDSQADVHLHEEEQDRKKDDSEAR
jgi:general secretion pathway protein D